MAQGRGFPLRAQSSLHGPPLQGSRAAYGPIYYMVLLTGKDEHSLVVLEQRSQDLNFSIMSLAETQEARRLLQCVSR